MILQNFVTTFQFWLKLENIRHIMQTHVSVHIINMTHSMLSGEKNSTQFYAKYLTPCIL